ncbi:tRNA pseudouridine(55) synthase TruB [Geobacter pickeringii]|uniref:tRNA pseudouridine synthase B n=1 Tax=Geobacter pickeringii TaxID=345632 RepID=A0A0B5B968_9BACT|nr:tRNA pseudouridine(55) synthase TruB [Geobacter pickeringii]AJE03278.1 pseudouridine synthase [Geobacter pickeringii]
MDGFIVLDKPVGITSHDVVSAVRRTLRQKKAGHTGTLDPFATGVLPVAIGEGTKAIPFLDEGIKEYQATMVLGSVTDTQDCTGTVIRQSEWEDLAPERIVAAIQSFVGRQSQLPPMFSAVKRNGVPLYKLARKGEEVERTARDIEIYSIAVELVELPLVTFTVSCSRGTYVRALASDIGEALGCGAHLTALRRTKSGPFVIDHALRLDEFRRIAEAGDIERHVTAPGEALDHLRMLCLADEGAERVRHGMAPRLSDFTAMLENVRVGEQLRLTYGGHLLAIAESRGALWSENSKNLRLIRVFNEV